MLRRVLIAGGAIALAVTAAGISLTMFLNGSGLRSRVETTLSKALGRPVTIGRLELSLWTGSLLAERMTIADDPRFGTLPFVAAERVRMGVEVLPLVLTRQVRLDRFAFEQPVIRLTRAADGSWNYSSLGPQKTPAAAQTGAAVKKPGLAGRFAADLAVSSLRVDDAIVALTLASPGKPLETRVYDHIDVGVDHFGLEKAFPFRIAARLPREGRIEVKGSAGPFVRSDLTATPLSARVEVRHLDLEPAGLVTANSGVSGLLERVNFDLNWTGETFHVGKLTVVSPRFAVAHRPEPPLPAGPEKEGIWSRLAEHLEVEEARIKLDSLTLTGIGPGADRGPRVYRAIDVVLTQWIPGHGAPFVALAIIPGNGSVAAKGTVQVPRKELASELGAKQPLGFAAHVSVHHLDLAQSGLLPAHSAIAGLLDADAQVSSDGAVLAVSGTTQVARLKLARNGQPSPRLVSASFVVHHRLQAPVGGTIDRATVSLGGPVIEVAGSYLAGKPATSLNLRVRGDSLPIDGLEAFLPVVGVELPEGSRLAGGTLTLALAVAGEPANLDLSGPVRLENTRLAGFDLGAKLASLAKFTGGRLGSATVSGTNIRSLALDLHVGNGLVRTDNLAFSVAGIGPGTGSGTVGPGGALNYKVSLKLTELVSGPDGGSGLARDLASQLPRGWRGFARGAIDYLASGPMKNGIPILIGGTTRRPTFTPNLGALIPAERPRR